MNDKDKEYLRHLKEELVMHSRHDGWSLQWYKDALNKHISKTSKAIKKNENDNENKKSD